MELKQVYHPYNLWEDFKNGMYSIPSNKEYQKSVVLSFFKNPNLVEIYMDKVINEWPISCEHNLSNLSMNRVAYIGQAACNIYGEIPNISTMYAWKFIDSDLRDLADKIAIKTILKWEQKQKYKNIYLNGKIRDTNQESQMKLLLN